MSEDAAIRLANLQRHCRNHRPPLLPADLARRMGSRVSFWSDLLGGKKSFGEKIARRIEAGLGLERGSLDDPAGTQVSIAPAWPFERISHTQWGGLSERQKGVIEDAAVRALRGVNLDAPGPEDDYQPMRQIPQPLAIPHRADKGPRRYIGDTSDWAIRSGRTPVTPPLPPKMPKMPKKKVG